MTEEVIHLPDASKPPTAETHPETHPEYELEMNVKDEELVPVYRVAKKLSKTTQAYVGTSPEDATQVVKLRVPPTQLSEVLVGLTELLKQPPLMRVRVVQVAGPPPSPAQPKVVQAPPGKRGPVRRPGGATAQEWVLTLAMLNALEKIVFSETDMRSRLRTYGYQDSTIDYAIREARSEGLIASNYLKEKDPVHNYHTYTDYYYPTAKGTEKWPKQGWGHYNGYKKPRTPMTPEEVVAWAEERKADGTLWDEDYYYGYQKNSDWDD